jgi:hypothetical protein
VFAFRRTLERKRVVINLLSDRAFTGVLWAKRGTYYVLRDATMHEPGAEPAAVDGEVVIEHDRVEFIQITG